MMIRHLSACFSPELQSLHRHLNQLTDLNQHLLAALPPELRPYCVVADFQKGMLLIAVSDAVWLTALRYALPALRDELRKAPGMHGLVSIQTKVQPGLFELKNKKKAAEKHLSETAKNALKALRKITP